MGWAYRNEAGFDPPPNTEAENKRPRVENLIGKLGLPRLIES